MKKQKLIILAGVIIGVIVLVGFISNISAYKSTENYKCSGVLENKYGKEYLDIYFKIKKYPKWFSGYGNLTIEIPNKINSLLYLRLNKIDNIIFFYRIENDFLNSGQFSELSKTLIFVDEIWGSFSGDCEKIN